MFETTHEKDLEKDVNSFLKEIPDNRIFDIKYQMAMIPENEEDKECSTYSFSAMVIYQSK